MMDLPFDGFFIHGFRGLRSLRLDGLGPINILVGGNNSGKTSVLEALSIMSNPFDPHEWLAMIRRRDFGGLDETRIQSLRWCFAQYGELANPEYDFHGECEMKCTGAFPLRRLLVEYNDIQGFPDEIELKRLTQKSRNAAEAIDFDEPWRGADLTHYVETDTTSNQPTLFDLPASTIIEPRSIHFWENDPMIGRPYRANRKQRLACETLTPYSYQLNRLQVRSHSSQLFTPAFRYKSGREQVLHLVQQFDPDVTDIEIASFRGVRPAIYLNHRRMGPAPLSVFGDALRRAVLLSSTLHSIKGGVLLIDEVESGIHIGALSRVFEWLIQAARLFRVQIVATTHSLEAVDGIVDALGSDVQDLVTFHLEQDTSQTRVKRIAGNVLQRLRKQRGLDVR